jgi:hypothetical protein
MGVCIGVGILADLAENDLESVDEERAHFDVINDVLRRHGLPEHHEPTSFPEPLRQYGPGGFPYSFLHYLRRFYARWIARRGLVPPPVREGERPADDPILEEVASPKHHLLWHSDCEGYYVPIDFPEVLEDRRLTGLWLGSSVLLREELIGIAAPLGIELHDGQLREADARAIDEESESGGPYWIERLVWLTLFHAACLSIESKSAIYLG